ncbi:hypothetical protein [Streptomyces sp. NPDC049970]|uniref:hypothetical protein n=1 Tax=Streptomyces sp. NPDC049970 TaxID=3155033 RepID=UPI003419FAE6
MTKPSDDKPTASGPEGVREKAEEVRDELGRTVEALVAKADAADVKDEAEQKAAEAKEQAAAKAGELKAKAAEAAHRVQDAVPVPVKDKAAQAAEEVRAKAAAAGSLWEDKAPEPVRRKAAKGALLARENRTALLAAAGVVAVAWAAYRRRKS